MGLPERDVGKCHEACNTSRQHAPKLVPTTIGVLQLKLVGPADRYRHMRH